MSTLTVTAERLIVEGHPNADALELAQVGLYRAVVAKGAYRTGDHALYIPEGAVLPDDLIAELGLTGRLAGSARNRVKAVRLRGELSQGIVCSPAALAGEDLRNHAGARTNFADALGITKYVPLVPTHMAGEVMPAPDLLRWIEVEDIRRYPDMFEPGEAVVATEKIHGTACLLTVIGGEAFVSSKGFGGKHLSIVESPTNLYWRAVRAHGAIEVANAIAERIGATRVGIFGEVYGRGVQDLGYDAVAGQTPGYAVFDIAVDTPGDGVRWLNPDEVAVNASPLRTVPVLYTGGYDETTLIGLASGATVVGGGAHMREGIVVRPAVERRSPITGHRAIGKLVSPAYLTRKGGTEYE